MTTMVTETAAEMAAAVAAHQIISNPV